MYNKEKNKEVDVKELKAKVAELRSAIEQDNPTAVTASVNAIEEAVNKL